MTTVVDKLPHKNFEYFGMELIEDIPHRVYEEGYTQKEPEYTDVCPDCGCRLEVWYCPDCDETWDEYDLEIEEEEEEPEVEYYAVPCTQQEYDEEMGAQRQKHLLQLRYGENIPKHIQDFWDGVAKIGWRRR